jgi:hypothetical protein
MISRQYRAGKRMVERIGPVELMFRKVAAELIGYEQLGTRVRLFGRSVPLPAGHARISAPARACGQSRFLVAVTVAAARRAVADLLGIPGPGGVAMVSVLWLLALLGALGILTRCTTTSGAASCRPACPACGRS